MPALELSGLVAAIKFLFESIKGEVAMPAEKRKKWFDDHIEPSYKQISAIHQDYLQQFSKALESLKAGTNLEEVVSVLKRDRPNLLLNRQEVRENLIALRDYRLSKKRKPKVILTFYEYVSLVDEYLNAASPLPRASWYSYFIDEFANLVERGKNPLSYGYPGCSEGNRAPRIAMDQLEEAVQRNMPEALKKIQESYGKLRVECLAQI